MPTPEQLEKARGQMPVHTRLPGVTAVEGGPPLPQGRYLAVSADGSRAGVVDPRTLEAGVAQVARMMGFSNPTPEQIEVIRRQGQAAKALLAEKMIPLPGPEDLPPVTLLTRPLEELSDDQRRVVTDALNKTSVELQQLKIRQDRALAELANPQAPVRDVVGSAIAAIRGESGFPVWHAPASPAPAPREPSAFGSHGDASTGFYTPPPAPPAEEWKPMPSPIQSLVPRPEPPVEQPEAEKDEKDDAEKDTEKDAGLPPNVPCPHCGCPPDYAGPELSDQDRRDWLACLFGAKFVREYPLVGDQVVVAFRKLTDAEDREICREAYAMLDKGLLREGFEMQEYIATTRMLVQVAHVGRVDAYKALPPGLSPATNRKASGWWFSAEPTTGQIGETLRSAFSTEGYEDFFLRAMRVQHARFFELCRALATKGLSSDFFTTTASRA
jgi:hypothetical protein